MPSAGTPKTQIDTRRPQPARVYDFLLGGKDNYEVDRALGEQLPELAKLSARQNRAFMHRSAAWLAHQGVDQFLDIGTGIPTEPNLHQIVQGITPKARVVYTDNDPIVLRHAEALMVSTPEGSTQYIDADVREAKTILRRAGRQLDFDRPVALSLIALMHFIPDGNGPDDPYVIVGTLLDALAPGSFLTLSHGTFDFHPELEAKVTGTYKRGGIRTQPRTRDQVARFLDGLDLVEPGLVTAPGWFKDGDVPKREESAIYAAVARVR